MSVFIGKNNFLNIIKGTILPPGQFARSTVGRGSQRRVRRSPQLRV